MSKYLYSHGISSITETPVMYSASLIPPRISHYDYGMYECLEHEYIGKPSGTRVMVKKMKRPGLIIHYLTVKNDYGWTRTTVVFKEHEADPYPAHIDEVAEYSME